VAAAVNVGGRPSLTGWCCRGLGGKGTVGGGGVDIPGLSVSGGRSIHDGRGGGGGGGGGWSDTIFPAVPVSDGDNQRRQLRLGLLELLGEGGALTNLDPCRVNGWT
jgi:hypothetical protein